MKRFRCVLLTNIPYETSGNDIRNIERICRNGDYGFLVDFQFNRDTETGVSTVLLISDFHLSDDSTKIMSFSTYIGDGGVGFQYLLGWGKFTHLSSYLLVTSIFG